MRHPLIRIALTAAAALCICRPALADEIVWATGRVFAQDGKTPLAGALVAAYDDKNHVVDYAKTDENGRYALAVPRGVLHLSGGGGGFFHQVMGTIGGVVGGVGKVAALPLKEGIRVAAQAANATDPLTKVGVGAASTVARSIVDTISPNERKGVTAARQQPGAVVLKVSLPGKNDAVNVARVYWMQEELYRGGGKEQRALTAWIDPAHLSAAGEQKPSTIASEYMLFTDARVEPSIAEIGQTVILSVSLPVPADPVTPIVVVARNSRTGKRYLLQKADGNTYRAEILVDKHFPADDQAFSVVAYAEQSTGAGRDQKVESAIERSGLWAPNKPFVYNPLLVASRNRADVTLTVVRAARKR